jgi:hypothetical protein
MIFFSLIAFVGAWTALSAYGLIQAIVGSVAFATSEGGETIELVHATALEPGDVLYRARARNCLSRLVPERGLGRGLASSARHLGAVWRFAPKGTAFAFECAKRFGKPYVIIDIDAEDATEQAAAFFGEGQGPLTFCIGGPRESEAPGIYAKAREFLRHLLASQI